MTSRNQNKSPVSRSPVNKKQAVTDDAPDKRRKIRTGRMMASTTASRGRQELAPVNIRKKAGVAPADDASECENIEFTKEAVNALLNESLLHSEGKQDCMTEYVKQLKGCIKWFQKALEDLVAEKENLSKMLELSKQKCVKTEAAMKSKNERLKTLIAKEESAKLESRGSATKEVDILRGELQQVMEDRDHQLCQVQNLTSALNDHKDTIGRTIDDIKNLMIKFSALEEKCKSQEEEISHLQNKFADANKTPGVASGTIGLERERILELEAKLRASEAQLLEGESLRKKLHNTILELKGNIRVFCRVRPLLPDVGPEAESAVSYPTGVESAGRGIDLIQSGQKYSFTFDKVFAHDASQQDVFMEISQLVQSALDGYKVSIFAYGQTGSGKTYTMFGTPQQGGLIPRSLEQVFNTRQALAAQGWEYQMQASMLEIYNETIRDLLSPNARVSGAAKKYTISHDAKGNTNVSNLTIVDVGSFREVSQLLLEAERNRSFAQTDMNENSSRSHFVFTLRIHGENESTEQVQGVLNFIDLAGSERASRSGVAGERMEETKAINRSLSSLGVVISALANKENHVPFRNSKLTHLLQPCLSGDSKPLMFVNVSPDPSSVGESLCSLRFAERANSCVIGIPRRQTSKDDDAL